MQIRSVLVAAAVAAFAPAVGRADDPIMTVRGSEGFDLRINRPPVGQRTTDYPEIHFQPGDTVIVNAGGCVQTGGLGKTWKRYVDPLGDNSDRLYHGRIEIPTATDGLETIEGVMRRNPLRVLSVPSGVDPSTLHLRLGYDDDDYPDNGYWGHDDGTSDQCKGVGDAWVTLSVTHLPSVTMVTPPPKPQAPMDLWWDAVDDNLIPINPFWGAQLGADGKPNGTVPDPGALCNHFHDEGDSLKLNGCTTQRPTVDEPSFWHDAAFWAVCQIGPAAAPSGTVHGHINWGLATYTGTLLFNDWSKPIPQGWGDDDYNFVLIRDDQASATVHSWAVGSKRALDLEFDSDETIDLFNTPFWNYFHMWVDTDDGRKRSLDGAPAIVTGLIGMDNEHDTKSELHPVLGLMAKVPSWSAPTKDQWVLFGRVRGDEGGCSQDQHEFTSTDTMQFLLPIPADLKPELGDITLKSNVSGASWSHRELDDGLLITLHFPPNSILTPMIWGEFTVKHLAASEFTASKIFRPYQPFFRTAELSAFSEAKPAKAAASTAIPMQATRKPATTVVSPGVQRRPISDLHETDQKLAAIAEKLTPSELAAWMKAYAAPIPTPTRVRPPAETPHTSSRSFTAMTGRISDLNLMRDGYNVAPQILGDAPRHHVLNPYEDRILTRGVAVTDLAKAAMREHLAAALRTAVGNEKYQQLVKPSDPKRKPSGDPVHR